MVTVHKIIFYPFSDNIRMCEISAVKKPKF